MKNIFSKIKFEFSDFTDKFLNGGKTSVIVVLVSLVLTLAACLAVFFMSVQGAEKVLVPNVVGKTLTDALLEMQAKELYPKIILKFSDKLGDKGNIIEQNPKAGAIVKAYRRVTITVSRGESIESIGDYVGRDADEVRNTLELAFSGEDSLVDLAPAVYIKDEKNAGTIIAQYPEAGTPIAEKIRLQLVVSSGEENEKVQVPEFENLSIKKMLSLMNETKLVYDFKVTENDAAPSAGKINYAEKTEKTVDAFTRLNASVEVKPAGEKDESVQGIFTCQTIEYPYPVPMVLTVKTPEGKSVELLSINHPGNTFTAPYDVKKKSTLILTVLGDEVARVLVE